MRIALLTSRSQFRDPFYNFYQHAAISLGPLYLESYLREYGPQADVWVVDTLAEAIALNPDLVGLSVTSSNFTVAKQQAAAIKTRLNIPVVIGGPHITALPQTLSREFDVGVLGEGEETFRQVVIALQQGAFTPEHLSTVQGLVLHNQHGKLIVTPARPPISPIDLIPRPRRVAWAKSVGIAHVVSARGCPFRCTFCTQSETMTKYRVFSPHVIVEEIRDLVDHFDARHVRFFDDVFNISLKNVRELSKAIRAAGLDKEVVFSAWGRASTLTPEMVHALSEMNIRMLAFGFESGSDAVLEKLKTSTTVAHNERALDLCESAGMTVAGTFIIGNPGETEEDLEKTYLFVEKNIDRLGDVEINPIIPLPGTALWQTALARGVVSNDMPDWGILQDQAYLKMFDPEKYLYLNDAMPYEKFIWYVKQFEQLLERMSAKPHIHATTETFYKNLQPALLRS